MDKETVEELQTLTLLLEDILNETVKETFGSFPRLIVTTRESDDAVALDILFEPISKEIFESYPEGALEEVLAWAENSVSEILEDL